MKIQFTKHLLVLVFMMLNINAFSQANRLINQDTIFYSSNNWNTKIGSQLIPFDSTNLIIKFNQSLNKVSIFNYLQFKNIKLVDSLSGFYLCTLDSNWTLTRSFDTLDNSNLFESIEINSSGVLDFNPNDPLFIEQLHINNLNYTSLDIKNV